MIKIKKKKKDGCKSTTHRCISSLCTIKTTSYCFWRNADVLLNHTASTPHRFACSASLSKRSGHSPPPLLTLS